MQHRRRTQSRHAFTLIELLTVIAIIAVLAGIIFPVFAQTREKGRQIACASNLRQLGMAILQYTQDYDEQLPGTYNGDYGIDSAYNRIGGWIYYNEFAQNNPNRKVFDPKLGSIYPYVKNERIYICPTDGGGETIGNSYAMNSCVAEPAADATVFFIAGKPLAKMANPTGTMLLSEEENPASGHSTNDGYLALNFGSGGDSVTDRHSKGSNISFVDGHVKWYRSDNVHPAGLQTGIPGEQSGVSVCP